MAWQCIKRVCAGRWNSCANIIISICQSTGNLLCKHHSCFTFLFYYYFFFAIIMFGISYFIEIENIFVEIIVDKSKN